MFQKPRAAKRLYFDVIPRAVDDYLDLRRASSPNEAPAQRLENPVWHIHNGKPPQLSSDLSYGILLNLASVANAEEKSQLWGFITRYRPDATPQTRAVPRPAGRLCDQLLPRLREADEAVPRAERDRARRAWPSCCAYLEQRAGECRCRDLQTEVYEIGKRHPFPELRAWFKALYEVLLGQDQGPRFGSFIALYGAQGDGGI